MRSISRSYNRNLLLTIFFSMKTLCLTASLIVLLSCVSNLAQTENKFLVSVDGIVRDKGNKVIPGLRLAFRNEASAVNTFTDINGHFEVNLSTGDYVLTIDSVSPDDFKAFIKISPKALNPKALDFGIDGSKIC